MENNKSTKIESLVAGAQLERAPRLVVTDDDIGEDEGSLLMSEVRVSVHPEPAEVSLHDEISAAESHGGSEVEEMGIMEHLTPIAKVRSTPEIQVTEAGKENLLQDVEEESFSASDVEDDEEKVQPLAHSKESTDSGDDLAGQSRSQAALKAVEPTDQLRSKITLQKYDSVDPTALGKTPQNDDSVGHKGLEEAHQNDRADHQPTNSVKEIILGDPLDSETGKWAQKGADDSSEDEEHGVKSRSSVSSGQDPEEVGPHTTKEVERIPAEELLEIINERLRLVVKEGAEQCNGQMTGWTDRKEALTSRQLDNLHLLTQRAILDAFEVTYGVLLNSDLPEIQQILQKAKLALEKSTYSKDLANQYNARYEIGIAAVLKKHQSCTLKSEQIYDALMEDFLPHQLSIQEIEVRHDEARVQTMLAFEEFLKENELELTEYSSFELEHKLREKLQQMQSDRFQTDPIFQTLSRVKNITSSSGTSLGIFLDQQTVTVGTMESGNLAKKVDDCPLEMIFQDHKVLIGLPAQKYQGSENYFNIYNLIKQSESSNHLIRIKSFCASITTEEILAMFFTHVLIGLKRQLPSESPTVGNVVLTTAFPCSSFEKERILMSARMAGLKHIRILSSTMSAGISFAKAYSTVDPSERLPDQQHAEDINSSSGAATTTINPAAPFTKKLILVVHSIEESFSMAVLEIQPGAIKCLEFCSSVNIKEFNEIPNKFPDMHSRVFKNQGGQDSEDFKIISESYGRVKQHLLKSLGRSSFDDIIIVNNFKSPLLAAVITRVFQGFTPLSEAPLSGACIFAARNFDPEQFDVYDYTNSRFYLYFNHQLLPPENTKKDYISCSEAPLFQFTLQSYASLLVVEEIRSMGSSKNVVAGQFYVSVEPEDDRAECKVVLKPRLDLDGIFNLIFDIKNATRGSIVRSDQAFLYGPSKGGLLYENLLGVYKEESAASGMWTKLLKLLRR